MTENTLFPGRPNYTGPTTGVFFAIHHDRICERSRDIMERVRYIKKYKAKNEIEIRLHNLMYLGGCEAAAKRDALYADYMAKRDALYADYMAKRDALYADYMAKRDALYADYEAKCDALDADYKAKRDALYADYEAKCAQLDADYDAECEALYADYEAKCAPLDAEILAYVRQHIPDCAWDEKEGELRLAPPPKRTVWLNVYRGGIVTGPHDTKVKADDVAIVIGRDRRIDCIPVEIPTE